MTEMQTMVRTQVTVNDVGFFLAQGQDIDQLKGEIVSAAQTGGRFVEFVVVGNRSVSVLISTATQVVISVESVQYDHRDTGDDSAPYGGAFDLI
ncbi:hypothetical protein [Microbacterium sp. PMB16]|uniref:hypothetical protein n=1 Tax=Microbacterium sp. PMB16 TaxID=3120157 RepID=UPI003F4BE3D7